MKHLTYQTRNTLFQLIYRLFLILFFQIAVFNSANANALKASSILKDLSAKKSRVVEQAIFQTVVLKNSAPNRDYDAFIQKIRELQESGKVFSIRHKARLALLWLEHPQICKLPDNSKDINPEIFFDLMSQYVCQAVNVYSNVMESLNSQQ